jgi:hypothetical protein
LRRGLEQLNRKFSYGIQLNRSSER